MSDEPELAAMTAVLGALRPLDSGAQSRVLRWVIEKLELTVSLGGTTASHTPMHERQSQGADRDDGHLQLPQPVAVWARQNGIVAAELDQVFHKNNDEIAVIAHDIPGKSKQQKIINCYILTGLSEFLRTGDGSFSDNEARNLCDTYGCLDTSNHSKYMNNIGNGFTGSKVKGWILTAPGKKLAAALIKEIAAATA